MKRGWWLALLAACTSPVEERHAAIGGGAIDREDPSVVMVNLRQGWNLSGSCSGVAISPRVVLTAAHCIPDVADPSAQVWIAFGPKETESHRAVFGKPHVNPRWKLGTAVGDVAVVVANQPLCVPAVPLLGRALDDGDLGAPLRLVGYGRDEHLSAGVKRQATVALSDLGEGYLTMLDEDKWCCYGDSGGPALLSVDGEERVAGVASRVTCDNLSIHARVDANLRFIQPFIDADRAPADCAPPPSVGSGCSMAGF